MQDWQQVAGGTPRPPGPVLRRASRQWPHHQPQQVYLHGAQAGGVGPHHQQCKHHPHPPAHTGNHRHPPPRMRNSCSATWGWSTSTAIAHQLLHRNPLMPWRQMSLTLSLVAPTTNRFEALGSHWFPFSRKLQLAGSKFSTLD
jgi:hypothetical protein